MLLGIAALDRSGGFSLSHDCGAAVAAGASCTLAIVFRPSSPGAYVTDARLVTNAPDGPSLLRLTGLATPVPVGRIGSEPRSLAFGDQIIGTTSAPKAIALTNTGSAAISILGSTVSGDFSLQGASCMRVGPGESCSFGVTFTPIQPGMRSGQVLVTSDADISPFGIGLSGNGVPVPAPRMTLSASSLGFGNAFVGTIATKVVTVTNDGTADLVFGAFAEGGGDFHVTNECTGTLAPGASCAVEVSFAPSLSGPRAGEVKFVSNAEGSPHQVGLAGVGCRFAFAGRNRSLVCSP